MIDKTIKKAFVHYNNDPSVGMFPFGYEIEVNIDKPELEELNEIREKIKELYEFIEGEKPSYVMFDFEVEAENEMEKELDRQREEWEKENDIQEDRELAAELAAERELLAQSEGANDDYIQRHNERVIRNRI